MGSVTLATNAIEEKGVGGCKVAGNWDFPHFFFLGGGGRGVFRSC